MIVPTEENIKTVTDLRENTLKLLALVGEKKKPVFIFRGSRPTNVVMLPKDEYLEILEIVEDYFDEVEAAEMEKEPKKEGIPLEKIMAEYGLKPRRELKRG